MIPDDSARSAEAERANAYSWPPTEKEVTETDVILSQIHGMIGQIELTIDRAKTYLAVLADGAPNFQRSLISIDSGQDLTQLADLQAARGMRAELVKAAQQSVAVSQSAAKYLQARERFLLARRDWIKRTRG